MTKIDYDVGDKVRTTGKGWRKSQLGIVGVVTSKVATVNPETKQPTYLVAMQPDGDFKREPMGGYYYHFTTRGVK